MQQTMIVLMVTVICASQFNCRNIKGIGD